MQFDDGTFFALGHEAVKCADKVDRDLGFAQGGEDAFAHTRRIERRGAGRHDSIVARFQLAAQLLAFLAKVAGGPGEKHGVAGGSRRSSRCGAAGRCHRQQSGKVLSDIVNPCTKHLAGIRAWIEQEIPGALGCGVNPIELRSQHFVEEGRQSASFHRQAEHLDDPLEISDAKIPAVLGGLGEADQLAIAPFRSHVCRRNDRY